ncbi:MAG: hypothetical protein V7642_6896 [Burkholderiales bacterium]|jgi:hypothetical protein
MKLLAPLLGISLFATSPTLSLAQTNMVIPPGDRVAGLSQAQWSNAWWQWAGSFNRNDSPIADRNGDKCHLKQSGPVWFLAGTYGTQRTIRTCRVPKDKYLFFPLINYVVMRPVSRSVSCDAVTDSAREMTNDVSSLLMDIDGRRVDNLGAHRQATKECFDMGARTDEKYTVFPSAANGYYVMLRPLSPGKHVLNFGGALPSMLQAVTYTLVVD